MATARALVDHYLKTAGIAAIVIGPNGEVTGFATNCIDLPLGLICFACLQSDVERLAAPASTPPRRPSRGRRPN